MSSRRQIFDWSSDEEGEYLNTSSEHQSSTEPRPSKKTKRSNGLMAHTGPTTNETYAAPPHGEKYQSPRLKPLVSALALLPHKDGMLAFLEEEGGDEQTSSSTAADVAVAAVSSAPSITTFADEDDFYIQLSRSNNQQQLTSFASSEVVQLVSSRSAKIVGYPSHSDGSYTIVCFRNHVFDADKTNIIAKWCPQCEFLRSEILTFAEQLGGSIESKFLEPTICLRCKYYHKWPVAISATSPINIIVKAKPWCPKCPDVFNLMIAHHHRGAQDDAERVAQIEEVAELITEGYIETNQATALSSSHKEAYAVTFAKIKDLYFLMEIDGELYRRYLSKMLPNEDDQKNEFCDKYTLLDTIKHPLARQVKEKLQRICEHLHQTNEATDEAQQITNDG